MKPSKFKKFNADEFLKRFNEHVSKFSPMEFEQVKTVTSVTPTFLTDNEIGNSCKALQNKGYRGAVTSVTPVTPKNDNSQNYSNIFHTTEEVEERVAIMEYDSRIPNEWAEAMVKTQTRAKPATISSNNWARVQNALERLLPHLKTIVAHDWKLSDIFGCHQSAPEARYDAMGLLMLLNEGERIIKITRDVIKVQNKRGTVQSYTRPFYDYQSEGSFLYEIEADKSDITSVETGATRMKEIIKEFNNKALLELIEKAANNEI